MKRKLAFVIFLLFPLMLCAQLEETFEEQHSFTGGIFPKVDSMSDKRLSFWPEIYGTYESNLSERLAGFFRMNVIIPLTVSFQSGEVYGDSISNHRAKGFGMTLGARYYINNVMRGVYVGPSVSYYRYNHAYEYANRLSEDEYSINSVRGSMVLGYQYISKSGFTIHAYAGLTLDHKNYAIFVTQVETEPIGSMSLLKPDAGLS
ncbi:MAG: DUF3575 domain-containing protein, partial [Bacteroidota bacterium]